MCKPLTVDVCVFQTLILRTCGSGWTVKPQDGFCGKYEDIIKFTIFEFVSKQICLS